MMSRNYFTKDVQRNSGLWNDSAEAMLGTTIEVTKNSFDVEDLKRSFVAAMCRSLWWFSSCVEPVPKTDGDFVPM